MHDTITPEMESAVSALDAFGNEHFPSYHSVTDTGEHDLYALVGREFDVLGFMAALPVDIDPDYGYVGGPIKSQETELDYLAAHMIATSDFDWYLRDREVDNWPTVVAKYGERATDRGLCILLDSSCISELLSDFYSLEPTMARDLLSDYMRLLSAADEAYRIAGWEL